MHSVRKEVQIGDCRLLLGDCLEILPTLGKVDAVVTDPPYMMGSAATRSPNGRPKSRIGDWTNAAAFYRHWLQICWSALDEDGNIWACANWRSFPVYQIALDSAGMPLSSVAIWDKQWIGVGPLNGLRQSYELILHSAKGKGVKGRSINDIWPVKWASQRPSGHESEKPVELMQRCIYASEAGTVLDPFMGSGTTGVACANLGKEFIGIEIDEGYFDIACRRIQEAVNRPDMFIEPRSPEPKQEALSL